MGLMYNEDNAVFRSDPKNYNTSNQTVGGYAQDSIISEQQANDYSSIAIELASDTTGTFTTTATEDFIATYLQVNIYKNAVSNNYQRHTIFFNGLLMASYIIAFNTNQVSVNDKLYLPNIIVRTGDVFTVDISGSAVGDGSSKYILGGYALQP